MSGALLSRDSNPLSLSREPRERGQRVAREAEVLGSEDRGRGSQRGGDFSRILKP